MTTPEYATLIITLVIIAPVGWGMNVWMMYVSIYDPVNSGINLDPDMPVWRRIIWFLLTLIPLGSAFVMAMRGLGVDIAGLIRKRKRRRRQREPNPPRRGRGQRFVSVCKEVWGQISVLTLNAYKGYQGVIRWFFGHERDEPLYLPEWVTNSPRTRKRKGSDPVVRRDEDTGEAAPVVYAEQEVHTT